MKKKIITIPNILTMIRILLIIPFVYFFLKQEYTKSFVIFVVSGITDLADGFIARRFNMISELGKALDPVADKLTQIVIFGCICSLNKRVFAFFCLLIAFELTKGIFFWIAHLRGAEWYGKVTSLMINVTAAAHVFMPNISETASTIMLVACTLMMTYSFVRYIMKCVVTLKSNRN